MEKKTTETGTMLEAERWTEAFEKDSKENPNIVELIFSEIPAKSWYEVPEREKYLTELIAFDMAKILNEPNRIEDEKANILKETQNLAFKNYKAFVQTAEGCRNVRQQFGIAYSLVENLLSQIPSFKDSCDEFMKEAENQLREQQQISENLDCYPQIMEILEIPQLADASVRNLYYEEALSLFSYMERLSRKLSDIPLMSQLLEEVYSSRSLMMHQIFSALKNPIDLPEALQLMSILRRLELFSDSELRIRFLLCRDSYLSSQTYILDRVESYSYLSKILEIFRVGLLETLHLYNSIFQEDVLPVSAPKFQFSSSNSWNQNHSLASSLCLSRILPSWIGFQLEVLLSLLKSYLPLVNDASQLNTLFNNSIYLSDTLSAVGLELRTLVLPIFEDVIFENFKIKVVYATNQLENQCTSASKKLVFNQQSSSQDVKFNGNSTTQPEASVGTQESTIHPPSSLLQFPSLSVACNLYLEAFQDLKQCAPLSLAFRVASLLVSNLTRISSVLEKSHSTFAYPSNSLEDVDFKSFCHSFSTDFVPFSVKCYSSLFGGVFHDRKLLETTISCDHITANLSFLNSSHPSIPQSPSLPTKFTSSVSSADQQYLEPAKNP